MWLENRLYFLENVIRSVVDITNSLCDRSASVRWSMSLTCLVDQHSALPDKTVCGFRRSNCQPSAIDRAFPVAAAQFWNRLLDNVTSANSLSAFRQQLKHTLFKQSFPDIIMWHFLTVTPIVVLAVALPLRPLNKLLIDWSNSPADPGWLLRCLSYRLLSAA